MPQQKKYQYALTRKPPISMAKGITTQSSTIDFPLAEKQHSNYITALTHLNIKVTTLTANEEYPDSHFVEDAAIIHNNHAILTRPGALSRRGEVNTLESDLIKHSLKIKKLGGGDEATLDGGDVLFVGDHVLIGLSHRTNLAGAQGLKDNLNEIDPRLTVHFIAFENMLHLKSGLTALNKDTLLVSPNIQLKTPLPINNVIMLPPEESHAANTLVANGSAFVFPDCPVTYQAIQAAGLNPIVIDMSEFRKMDGSFTCLSLLW